MKIIIITLLWKTDNCLKILRISPTFCPNFSMPYITELIVILTNVTYVLYSGQALFQN